MPLETASTIPDLVPSNPSHSDGLNNADAHIRLIKSVLQTTFPGLAAGGALLRTPGGIILPQDGTSGAPGYSFASEGTLGFYRSSAGIISIAGGTLRGKGAVPCGSVHMFIIPPASLGSSGGAGTGYEYLELDGGSWPISQYPDLATALGITTGTTINLWNMKDTGRFPRSRTAAQQAGTPQANTVGPHTHPDFNGVTSTENQGHAHAFSGTTGGMNANNPHNHTTTIPSNSGNTGAGGAFGNLPIGSNTSATDINHGHAFSGTTAAENVAHNHNFTSSTPANTGTAETRPEALSFIFAIKT